MTIKGTPLDRVSVYKLILLGVFISADLAGKCILCILFVKLCHDYIFLKQLKRVGLSSSHLLQFYTTVIRPVLEYASPLRHPTLTKSQTERLEAVQRRAINIIFGYFSSTPYLSILALADISSLQARPVSYTHLTLPTNREV